MRKYLQILDNSVHTHHSLTCDMQVAQVLRPYKGDLKKVWGSTLFHLDDVVGPSGALGPLGIRGMPDVFTPFKEKASTFV